MPKTQVSKKYILHTDHKIKSMLEGKLKVCIKYNVENRRDSEVHMWLDGGLDAV